MSEFTHALGSNPITGSVPQKTVDWLRAILGFVRTVNGNPPDSEGNVVVSGGGGGVSSWNDLQEKPPFIAAGATQAAARNAVGAGTSNLQLGTTPSTAKVGNWVPGLNDLPAGVTLQVMWSGSAWPARPTTRTDISVIWVGGPATRPAGALVGDLHLPDA